MGVTETQRTSDRAPIYREIPTPAGAPAGRTLGSTADVGLCPNCGGEQLQVSNENAMPLFVAGAALGVMSIPFMLVTVVGVVALIAAIPMMLAPLMMSKTTGICPKCSQS